MADPVKPVTIGVKAPDANVGEFVTVRNLKQGFKLTGAVGGTDRSISLTPPISEEWDNGAIIQAEMRGRLVAVSQKKLQAGGVKFTLAATADTSTVGIAL